MILLSIWKNLTLTENEDINFGDMFDSKLSFKIMRSIVFEISSPKNFIFSKSNVRNAKFGDKICMKVREGNETTSKRSIK